MAEIVEKNVDSLTGEELTEYCELLHAEITRLSAFKATASQAKDKKLRQANLEAKQKDLKKKSDAVSVKLEALQ